MLWRSGRESDNVVDQRSFGSKSLGLGGLIIGAIIYYFMGGNPLTYLAQNVGNTQIGPSVSAPEHHSGKGVVDQDADRKKFVSVVLADTEDVWNAVFKKHSQTYPNPKLVLFTGTVDSACGRASRSAGPFYCSGDKRLYLDMSFFDELSQNLGAKGEFAGAYVIAHEVGHHVQNVLNLHPGSSVKVELQADCLAGVWASQTERSKNVIEPGDIPQALNAAAAVGDDRLQKRSQGYVVPDSFTHGSSEQRVSAFKQGYEGGQLESCLTAL